MTDFVHLRLHTEYSLVDSVVRVPELMRACRAAGMASVALSDECNLFAMVKFYKAALEEGIKPIIGVDTWLRESGERAAPSRLTFLCQDLAGYRNLTRLVTKSYLAGSALGRPLLERTWLGGAQLGGLVVLSGGIEGDVGRSLLRGRASEAERLIDGWQALLGGRYYLEGARTG